MPRTPRQVPISDHLWNLYGRMAEEMGSDRDALVNEAMHAFARLHGYLAPGPAPSASEPPAATARERRAVTEQVLRTAERLERDIAGSRPAAETPTADAPPRPAGRGRAGVLWLRRDDGSVVEVARDRFVVGRGAHCDLIIDSAKISREHAAFVHDPEGWWIEDLGSSNGTWYRGERVRRRRVTDGDEFFLCAEKFRCAVR